MATSLPGPSSFDYTSRDYASIRDDLINLIPQFMPDWTSRDPNDLGIVLLELFSYVADNLNFYIDRIANESFLDSATQRSSVIRLARLFGYIPTNAVSAQAVLQFTNTSSVNGAIPAGTIVSTITSQSTSPVSFLTTAPLYLNAGATGTVAAVQGTQISAEQIGVSDGSIAQAFTLFNTNVSQGSVQITISQPDIATPWYYVPFLSTASPFDQVYTLFVDENGVVTVQFGDGVTGAVPAAGATILADYRIGGGAVGNVDANTLITITSQVPAGWAVTNPNAAVGGADAESTDSIRVNAVNALVTQQRATTLSDYASLAVTVPGIAKAYATSQVYTNVNVYVAPVGGGGLDSSGNATAAFSTLKKQVSAFLDTVKPAPTAVAILDPAYQSIDVGVTLHVAPNYRQDIAISNATTALTNLLAFDSVGFGQAVTQSDIHIALANTPGVIWVDITNLQLGGDSGSVANSSITLQPYQIPIAGNLAVTATGGVTTS